MIPLDILINYTFTRKKYAANQLIFEEGNTANYFYLIENGQVKMFNRTEDGKEFVQGYFTDNQSFGEPPFLGNFKYPANAIAIKETTICVLTKDVIFKVLRENPEIHLNLTTNLCKRMRYKAMIAKEVSVYPPMHRIVTLLNYLKEQSDTSDVLEIKLTRQQISELTGLRVETVIREIKKLEKKGELTIANRKIFV